MLQLSSLSKRRHQQESHMNHDRFGTARLTAHGGLMAVCAVRQQSEGCESTRGICDPA